MKFFTLVFSFYLMVVSLLPCSDARNECDNFPQPSPIEQNLNHSHQNDHNDVCSPFCTCSCCNVIAGFALQAMKVTDLKPDSAATLQYAVQDTSFISTYLRNIWQPPKMNA